MARARSKDTPLAPGFVLGGRVRLVRPIAAGGMGEVWIAVNEATGAEIAAKVWRAAGDGKSTRERFTHEAQLGAKLAHRSIVRIYDLVDDEGTLVLLMELLRGATLEQRVASGPMSAREAVATILPILSALDHAHAMGIVHRDVKPANIFLAVDPDGTTTPKLLDFGIAKVPAAGNHTVDGHVLGTPRYMSPEHIRGKIDLDGRSDLFSVGAVLYEMLTGRAPFGGATPGATLAAVLEQDIDSDPGIDGRLWTEIARALAKRPYERHRRAAELAAALCAAIGATESELASALPKVKPPPIGSASDYGSADLASEVPSRSQERPTVRSRQGRRAAWVVVACAMSVAVVALAVGTRRATRQAAVPVTTASVVTASAPASTTTSSSVPVIETATASIAPPTAPPRPTASAPAWRPRPAATSRGVATKPGF